MRKNIAAGNWKMNLNAEDAQSLASEVVHMYKDEYQGDAEVIFGVPHPFLSLVHHISKDHPKIHLAAQNLHQEEKGAYTGEVSASMLTSVGV
ncbi:MAG: triose-phosphate isomerase, partial [Bacteroidota bacterium]